MNKLDRLCMFFAWKLPKRLVYWAAIRLMASATQGKWSTQVVPELTCMDALNRWDEKNSSESKQQMQVATA